TDCARTRAWRGDRPHEPRLGDVRGRGSPFVDSLTTAGHARSGFYRRQVRHELHQAIPAPRPPGCESEGVNEPRAQLSFRKNTSATERIFPIVNYRVRRLANKNRRHNVLSKRVCGDDDVWLLIVALRRIRRLKIDLGYACDLHWLFVEITEPC